MPLTYDPFGAPAEMQGERISLSLPGPVIQRLRSLREKLEARFRIRLEDEELIEYLCEKALERLEDWERRTRPAPE